MAASTHDPWAGLDPLTPNPGGLSDPTDLVGRERELLRLHEAVTAGGAYVTGERRMGKTWLVKRLREDLAESVGAIYVSAETSDLDLFSKRLLDALRENRFTCPRLERWAKEVEGELKVSIGVAGLSLRGKTTRGIGGGEWDVMEFLATAPTGPMVLIIDEITHLCSALGTEAAGEFLSGLRSRRQTGGSPIVLSGSIGLHHVLKDFTSINDLWQVGVGPLDDSDAATLAARLLLGIGVQPTRVLVDDLVRETSGVPYYIHAVVDRLRYRADLDVAAVVAKCLDENLWNTDHYVARLADYYGVDGAAYARALLDVVAVADTPLRVDTIRDRIVAQDPDLALSRDATIDLLDRLEKDHYLVREDDEDRMSSPLLARIWRHHRRLS